MATTDAERAANRRYQAASVTRTSVRWYPADAELREWVEDHGGSSYLKALARADMDRASVTTDTAPTENGWHDFGDASYYVEDGMVTRATVGEGQSMLPAYLYVKTRGGGLSGIEFPRDAGEVVRMLLSGRWVIHS